MYDPSHLRRFVAMLIDNVLTLAVGVLISMGVARVPGGATLGAAVAGWAVAFAAVAGYFALCHWRGGQTPGKKLMKLRVVDRNGEGIGLGAAVVRAVALIGPSMVALLVRLIAIMTNDNGGLLLLAAALALLANLYGLANAFIVLGDRYRRGLHDLVAKTRCVSSAQMRFA